MPRREPLETGEYYHVFNRAIDDKLLFNNDSDYQRFLLSLELFNTTRRVKIKEALDTGPTGGCSPVGPVLAPQAEADTRLVDIACYTLMTNHYHLLIRQVSENGIYKFIQKLQTGYAGYFNRLNYRRGHLFQNQYHSVKIESNEQLVSVVRYIHLNPLDYCNPLWREGSVKNWDYCFKYLKDYPYTSLRHYLGNEKINLIDDSTANELIQIDHKIFLQDWATRNITS